MAGKTSEAKACHVPIFPPFCCIRPPSRAACQGMPVTSAACIVCRQASDGLASATAVGGINVRIENPAYRDGGTAHYRFNGGRRITCSRRDKADLDIPKAGDDVKGSRSPGSDCAVLGTAAPSRGGGG